MWETLLNYRRDVSMGNYIFCHPLEEDNGNNNNNEPNQPKVCCHKVFTHPTTHKLRSLRHHAAK